MSSRGRLSSCKNTDGESAFASENTTMLKMMYFLNEIRDWGKIFTESKLPHIQRLGKKSDSKSIHNIAVAMAFWIYYVNHARVMCFAKPAARWRMFKALVLEK